MKKVQYLIAAVVLAGLLTPKAASALTVTNLGGTAPTSDEYTYAQTADVGGGIPPANLTSNATVPGSTFTLSSLGTLPAGDTMLELTQIYIKDNANTTSGLSDLNWTLTIGTVSGSTFTAIDTESVTGVTVGKEAYVDLTLSDFVTLNADTEYAFTISTNGNVRLDGTDSAVYSGDVTGNSASVTPEDGVVTGSGSRTFYLDTVPVPEPADWALVPMIGALAFFGLRRFNRQSVMA
jgi:hypothetical protein